MSYEHNTNKIYRTMEGLHINMKALAKDMHMATKELTKMIDDGMPNIEADEIIDRLICLHVEKNRRLNCEDAELQAELMEYITEQATGEILHRLEWYYDILDEEKGGVE